ncbi:phage portal protein, partial [Candidatus Parcubacteria bacterium]
MLNFLNIFGRKEKRSTPGPLNDVWYQALNAAIIQSGANTGQLVTPETAQRLAAVYACITVISESVAMMPINLFRQVDERTKEPANDHPLYKL